MYFLCILYLYFINILFYKYFNFILDINIYIFIYF